MQIAVAISLAGSFVWLLVAPDRALDTNGDLRGLFNHKNILGQFAGIGYLGESREVRRTDESEIQELPQKLIDLLASDHVHQRAHKELIELDF